MGEIDLIQANYGAINLAYTTSTWWLTISMALVVGAYFAARHIGAWFLTVILSLYLLTAASVIYELHGYSTMAIDYAERLAALRGGAGVVERDVAWRGLGLMNADLNYCVIFLGSVSAAAYTYVTWRGARRAALPDVNPGRPPS